MSDTRQTNTFVWTTFTNMSGRDADGVVFLTGLITPNYIFCGIDGAIHLAEECKNAAVAVPRALMSIIGIGAVTTFVFLIAMLYSLTDLDSVLSSPTTSLTRKLNSYADLSKRLPVLAIWVNATRSLAAATVFLCVLTVLALVGLVCIQQTSSRLLWVFARDDAVVFSRFLKRLHPVYQVPVWALVFNTVVIFIIGCVYLGSSTAFNAIIGTSLVLQHISFAIPAALLLYRRRSTKYLPMDRSFNLRGFGWVANFVTLSFTLVVLVFYNLPVVLPVTGSNMSM